MPLRTGLQLAEGMEPRPLFWGDPSLTDPVHSPTWLYILALSGKLFKLVLWSFNVTLILLIFLEQSLVLQFFYLMLYVLYCQYFAGKPVAEMKFSIHSFLFPNAMGDLCYRSYLNSAQNCAASGSAHFCQVAGGGEG